jgi:hypothetical protein
MQKLVFDLRGNPGGAPRSGHSRLERFLPKGDLIVYTRGRVPNSDQDYRATEQSDYLRGADDHAGEPQQRERLGDCVGRASGSRPFTDRW